jgi:antitoxin HicB
MFTYPAILKPDSNGTLLVTFPDVPEAATFGEDEDEALMRAVEALESALDMYVDNGELLPEPSKPRRGQVLVRLPAIVTLKFLLYTVTLATGMKKAELARALNWHMPQVDRLFDIRHHSRLDQMEAAFNAIGKRIVLSVEDAT